MRLCVHDAYVHAIMYENVMFVNVCFCLRESKSLTGVGKLTPGLMWKNRVFVSVGDDGCKNTGRRR